MTSRPNKKRARPGGAVGGGSAVAVPRVRASTGGRRLTEWWARSELRARRPRELDLLVGATVVVLVAAPMLFTDSGFAVDFTNHLWLTWVAGKALVESGHPSYFLNASEVGVFYPWFAFYGGSLYMIVGGISELLGGHPVLAFVGVTTLAVAGSYLGMVWLGRELGLRGMLSHAPALTVVTSAYYITNLYGRGAWTELMATAVIAPLLASGVHLVRASRWRPLPIVVFVVSAVLFTGSHNITLLWGSTVAVLTGSILLLALGGVRRLPLRRLAMVAGLGGASVLVNAWYLAPDILYASDVRAHAYAVAVAGASFFDTPAVLLDPLRTVPSESTTPALYVQVPVWFFAWGLLAGPLLLWRRRPIAQLGRAWIGVVILIGVLLGMIMLTSLWGVMPFPFDEIQYPYRLGSYVFYAVGGLVLVGALALQRAASEREPARTATARTATASTATARTATARTVTGRTATARTVSRLRLGLAGVCAVSVGLCVWQQWVPSTLFTHVSYDNRREALASVNTIPRTWYDPGSYNDNSAPVLVAPSGRKLTIDPSRVHGDRFAAWLQLPPGLAPIQTNIAGGSYLVHLSGLRWLGRNQYGYAIVGREREGSGPVHVVIETSTRAPIVLGWVASVLAGLAILAVLAWACLRSFRARAQSTV
jgi:hypothetical protein